MISIQVLEEITLVQPFGLRFWDQVTQSAVSDGLVVTAWRSVQPQVITPASLNRSGVFSFRNLPGLREMENGAGDADFWWQHPPQIDFVVEVLDSENRFLPFRLPVRLPVRGIYQFGGQPFVPLYSTAARTVATPMAMIRAQLYDALHGVPAAWAVVDAHVDGGATVRGIADSRGQVLVPFPFPEPQGFGLGSPLRPGGIPLAGQSWQLHLAFAYTPGSTDGIPDLTQVLRQAPATAWDDELLSAPLTSATLSFGGELVLRTRAAAASPPASPWLSTLLITPAGSPP
jgi:hypothetical protein